MLDILDLQVKLDKATYQSQIESLMHQLRSLQEACWSQQLPVIVVLEGWAASGKGALVRKMVAYMDPRGFKVHPIWPPTETERQYPFLWRFWQKTPAQGAIAFFYHSWYTHVLEDRLFERVNPRQVPTVMAQINAFERQLVDDGAVIAKFWLHLSRKELQKRLKDYESDALTAWRVRPEDWLQAKHYDDYLGYAEDLLAQTSTGCAPWTLVESNCQRWARVKVLTQLCAVLTEALDRKRVSRPVLSLPAQAKLEPTEPDLLSQLDLSQFLTEADYRDRLEHNQVLLQQYQRSIHKHQIPVLVLFEGWDAAGKGGAIKRLTDVLDPRSYVVNPFAAPTTEEKAHHYLWRFWQQLPTPGTIGIFDRSWYGRVLVERVEGFAQDEEWRRAYREMNEFESMLTHAGYVLVKFWLHISPEEQLQRFQERQNDPFKGYKLTDEDWRNREKWSLYEVAVNQMLQRTQTPNAPWSLVPANDKYFARVQVIQTLVEAIEIAVKRHKHSH